MAAILSRPQCINKHQAITRTGVNSVPNPGPFGVIYGWWSRCLKLLIILTATDLCLVDTLLENIE